MPALPRRLATGVGAAIAVTGLKMALQTEARNLYHTGSPRLVFSGPSSAMDEPRALNSRADAVDTTFELVERAKTGDSAALNDLFARYLPSLRRWASGRLPRWTRDLMDTDDLVQETVVRAVKRMDRFESRHEGALQAYLRQAVVNRIRDEVRRAKRAPIAEALDDNAADGTASPLEKAIGAEALDRYEAALGRLRPEEREAIVARVEMDGSYHDVARALGKPSADAARMAVSRALLRLAQEMSRGQA
ncbi:MAG TPA: sigma-70 family RNA polymerase sigma factor [Vicinamibacterales bacterium]|nr:sigma-70 family RNA polymerase sigma factor [Vicinamibacterales bacterium]